MLSPFPILVKEFKNYISPLTIKESDSSDEESGDLFENETENKKDSTEIPNPENPEKKIEANPFDDETIIFDNLRELIGMQNLNHLLKLLFLYIKVSIS